MNLYIYVDFNNAWCQATKDTSTIAGLQALHIINKPTTIAITYGLNKKNDESQILVYSLGGGTFDISLLSINDSIFAVLMIASDTHLRGEYFKNGLLITLSSCTRKKLVPMSVVIYEFP